MHTMRSSVLILALFALSGAAHAGTYSESLNKAIEMCVALSPGHESELGGVASDEVSFWFRKARLEASREFWSPRGMRFLEAQLKDESDELKSTCIRQLVDEARVKHEVPRSG